MMKRNFFVLMLISCLFLLSGCVVGQKIDYASGPIPNLKEKGNKTVAVGVHDQRPYVTNTEKYPLYVGTFRGGFGNPFDVETASNKPLANDMQGILATALKNAGYKVVSLKVVFSDSKEAVLLKYKETGAERFILLTLNEWRNDTYVNTSIYYNVALSVYDRDLKQLAESRESGEKDLGSGALDTTTVAKEKAPIFFQELLGKMLNNNKVQAALH
jgi:hypothetical protein